MGQCTLKLIETSVESAWYRHLKLKYDDPVSSFAFGFNLRCYTQDASQWPGRLADVSFDGHRKFVQSDPCGGGGGGEASVPAHHPRRWGRFPTRSLLSSA